MLNYVLKIEFLLFLFSAFYGCKNSQTIHLSEDTIVRIRIEKDTINKRGGVCIYKSIFKHPVLGHFDADTVVLENPPFISYNDIIWYDTLTHTILLDTTTFKPAKIKKPFYTAFIVTLDNKRLYGGWFVWGGSSMIVHCACLRGISNNTIQIQLGYPNSTYFSGKDPRNNRALFDRLKADGKIKQN